jgi:uncharacterized membrane protein
MYPRARFDSLSDAIFGVAMTLLVLDLRLPEEACGLLAHTTAVERDQFLRERQVSLAILIGSALLAIAWSFFSPRYALLALALNAAAPAVSRLIGPPGTAKA